jgi:transposase-like protein
MRWTEVLQGLRRMKFEDIYGRWQERRLSQAEAAEILGMSERTFRRWRDRYQADGLEGLADRRLGKASARRVPVDRVDEVPCTASATLASRPSTSTTSCASTMASHSATAGPSAGSRMPAWCRRRRVARPTARSGHAGRSAGCCCTRTAHHTVGCRGSIRSSI